jgi:hypothetical protein
MLIVTGPSTAYAASTRCCGKCANCASTSRASVTSCRTSRSFFGDWHVARICEAIAARFHLGDWHRTIDIVEKVKTLDDLYQLVKADQNNRWMLLLEVTIVLLFIIDLVVLFLGLKL